ncbi:MAG: SAM-dependent methyltransferase [Bacteroidota bacterium]
MMAGKLFLIPSYLSASNDAGFIAPMVVEVLRNTSYYLTENVRTSRRFISSLKAGIVIENLHFDTLDKSTSWDDLYPLFEPVRMGEDMGVISEAGLPCLADPGNIAVSFAHQNHIQVVPMPGASSIQTALIASGFNGQQFTFHGYLPIDKKLRRQKIKELEGLSKTGFTQLFMETPYRNMQLFDDLKQICLPTTYLSIAANISGADEFIQTNSIEKWKKQKINLQKIPAIFSLGILA